MKEYKYAYFGKSFMMIGRSLERCFNCAYCRANDGCKMSYFLMPDSINPAFKNIPVAVNCFYGDPMLQVDETIHMLETLEAHGHKGPVIIITKGNLKLFYEKTKHRKFDLDIHFGIFTFGADCLQYDPRSFSDFRNNMDVASKMPYHYSVEFRPIIRNVNDDINSFSRVVDVAREHNTGIGYCGLQMSDNLKGRLDAAGIHFESYDGHKFGLKKYVGRDIDAEFRKICQSNSVPVFRKTSCLIAWKHGLDRDPNAHYYRPNEVGCAECPLKEKCQSFKNNLSDTDISAVIPFDYEIEEKTNHECGLFKLGVCKFPSADCRNISGKLIKIDDEITTTDVRLIKWLTGYTVDATFIESPYCSDKWVVR